VKYMLLIIGSQDADPETDGQGQGLMEAFMAYHKAVCDAGVMVDSNVLESFESATSVQVDRARGAHHHRRAVRRDQGVPRRLLHPRPSRPGQCDRLGGPLSRARAGRIEVRPIQELGLP
jgi:hypothetical protein